MPEGIDLIYEGITTICNAACIFTTHSTAYTHIYLWWFEDSSPLSADARKLIFDADCVYVSAASLWEAVIKIGLGKLEANPADLVAGIRESGFEPLPITPEHTLALPRLPNLHKDLLTVSSLPSP